MKAQAGRWKQTPGTCPMNPVPPVRKTCMMASGFSDSKGPIDGWTATRAHGRTSSPSAGLLPRKSGLGDWRARYPCNGGAKTPRRTRRQGGGCSKLPALQTDHVREVKQDLARGATPERHATRATAPHGTTCRIGRQPNHQLPLRTALGFRPPDLFRFSLSDLHHARCCCALHYLPSLPRFPLPGCHPRLLKVQRFPSYPIATANLHAAALQDEPSHTLTPDH